MYSEILEIVALAIAKNHGYVFSGNSSENTILTSQSARAYLFTADAEVALETINRYLIENEIEFSDLEVEQAYIFPVINQPAQKETLTIDWAKINKLVESLYEESGIVRSERSACEQYKSDKIEAILDGYSHKQLAIIYQNLCQEVSKPFHAPKTNKGKLGLAIWTMLNPYPDQVELTLYFDDEYMCVGGECADFWANNHHGNYVKANTRKLKIQIGFNPYKQHLLDILKYNTNQSFGGELSGTSKATQNANEETVKATEVTPANSQFDTTINRSQLTKKEIAYIDQIGVRREREFWQLLCIKAELKAIKISLGKSISSNSDVKGWYLISDVDKEQAALYWTTGNGWEIGTRKNQMRLCGVFEGFDIMEHLSNNGYDTNSWDDWDLPAEDLKSHYLTSLQDYRD